MGPNERGEEPLLFLCFFFEVGEVCARAHVCVRVRVCAYVYRGGSALSFRCTRDLFRPKIPPPPPLVSALA